MRERKGKSLNKSNNPLPNFAMEAKAQNNNQQCMQNKNIAYNSGKNTVKRKFKILSKNSVLTKMYLTCSTKNRAQLEIMF